MTCMSGSLRVIITRETAINATRITRLPLKNASHIVMHILSSSIIAIHIFELCNSQID